MGERNEIEYGDGFLRDARRLPREIVENLDSLLVVMKENIFEPRLHTKRLGPPLKDKYSFRVGRDWRVGFMFSGQYRIKLLVVDRRDKVYERMKRIRP